MASDNLQMLMLTHVSATTALVRISDVVVVDDVVATFAALRPDCETRLAFLDVAIAYHKVLTGCELHELGCDAQGDGTLDLWGCFRASLRYTVCYHFL